MKKKYNQTQMPIFNFLEKGISLLVGKILHKGEFTVFPKGEITELWKHVESLQGSLSVIEADKLVDNVLRRANIKGESMGERLRNVEKLVPRNVYNDMWEAHKVRNKLVHEIDHNLNYQTAETLLKMKRFLITLGAFKNE